MLLEKLDSFQSAPFTIQRISELLSEPKKQYSRIDKFMRAVEKTILVVSTIPPGRTRTESSDSLDSGMNGDYSDVNVDVDMDALEHKKNNNSHDEAAVKVDEDATTASKDDNVNGTITQVTVDSVSITVIEPERSKAAEESTASPTKAENEPLRSADNEILVETAELISETPPLAALENIVATTTVKIDATVLTPEIAATTAAAVVVTEKTEPVAVAEQPIVESETETEKTTESVGSDETEAKRMKLSEEETTKEAEVAAVVVAAEVTAPTEPAAAAEVEVAEPAATTLEAQSTESVAEVAKSETATETLQEETLPLPETTASVVTEPTIIAEVVETPPEAPPVSVAATVCETVDPPPTTTTTVPTPAAIEDEPVPIQEVDVPVAPVIEPIVAEMDAAPILQPEIAVENKMDDEEQPTTVAAASTLIEQDMTPVESGKMDTDESTTVEAAPMEFEDDAEPMDQ